MFGLEKFVGSWIFRFHSADIGQNFEAVTNLVSQDSQNCKQSSSKMNDLAHV